jgi:hypothetical protein
MIKINLNMETKLNQINQYLKSLAWCDFDVFSYDGFTLRIVGGIDVYEYCTLEIEFKDVHFMCLNADWKTDTQQKVFKYPHEDKLNELNFKYQIPIGYQLIEIAPEDFESDAQFYVACRELDFKIGFMNRKKKV